MEIRQLKYFSSIAKWRSFSKASEKLHIAQPALSRQIQALEDELGVKLLMRTVRGVEKTEAGGQLEEMADYILRYIAEIKPSLTHAGDEPGGVVTVGLPPSLATLIAPNLVTEARKRYPALKLKVIEGFSVFLHEWLEQGRIDLALLTDFGPSPTIDIRTLFEEDMVIVGAPSLMRNVGPDLPFQEISKFPLVVTNGFHKVIEPWLVAYRMTPHYDMEMDSIPIIKEMLIRGIACSIFPYSMVHEEVLRRDLQAARLIEPIIRRRVVRAISVGRQITISMRAVENLIEEQLSHLPMSPDPHAERGPCDPD